MKYDPFYTELHSLLLEQDRLLLTTHTNPDPDGIGGELGLEFFLKSHNKDVIIFNHDRISHKHSYLDPLKQIRSIEDNVDSALLRNRTVVLIDTSDAQRAGDVHKFITEKGVIAIDHHDSSSAGEKGIFQHSSIGSTSEIIYELLEMDSLTIPLHVATALYTGIVADTGHFQYSKTRPRTHEIAAKLQETGIHPPDVAEKLFHLSPAERLKAKQILYKNLVVLKEDHIAYFHISQREWEDLGLSSDDLGGVVNELIEPEDILVGVLFTPRSSSRVKVSVRSRGSIDMLPSVIPYGGGGHKNACGAAILLDLQSAIKEFIPLAISCIK